jgi:hypothetical protein
MREYTDLPFGLTKQEAEHTKEELQNEFNDVYDVAVLVGGGEDDPGHAVGFRRKLCTGHEIHGEIHEPVSQPQREQPNTVSQKDKEQTEPNQKNPNMQSEETNKDSEAEAKEENELDDETEEIHRLLEGIDKAHYESPTKRLQTLADLAHTIIQIKGLKNPDKIDRYCSEFGTHEVVGTGLGMMSIDRVLTQLGEYTELFTSLQVPSHGGEKEALEELSGNNESLSHCVYFALQKFYSEAIFALVIDQMEIFNTEAIINSPIGKNVAEFYNK